MGIGKQQRNRGAGGSGKSNNANGGVVTDVHTHPSGATSSHHSLPFHLISLQLRRRIAKRFRDGTEKHGAGNWLRAFGEGTVDIQFLQDRYNHAMEHFSMLAIDGGRMDDHIAAVGWFLNLAVEAEDLGLDWSDIMMVVTPEEVDVLRAHITASYRGRRRKHEVKK